MLEITVKKCNPLDSRVAYSILYEVEMFSQSGRAARLLTYLAKYGIGPWGPTLGGYTGNRSLLIAQRRRSVSVQGYASAVYHATVNRIK